MAPVFSVVVIMGQVSSDDKLSQLCLAPGLPLSQDLGWVISQKQNLGHSKQRCVINNNLCSNFVRSEYTFRTLR